MELGTLKRCLFIQQFTSQNSQVKSLFKVTFLPFPDWRSFNKNKIKILRDLKDGKVRRIPTLDPARIKTGLNFNKSYKEIVTSILLIVMTVIIITQLIGTGAYKNNLKVFCFKSRILISILHTYFNLANIHL